MKYIGLLAFLAFTIQGGFSQSQSPTQQTDRKGKLYFYWGWDRSWYNTSNIHFKGSNYDFTLEKVIAKDRQSPFNLNTYLNPAYATIPQYNFRIGYFIKKNYDISLGIDHMKYVVQADQVVKISGTINDTGTGYDKTYSNDDIAIKRNFLQFEHTDGLNYINAELRRFDELIKLNKVSINVTEGLGAGALLPRTDVTLLNNREHDEFHLAGFGIGGIVGLNITFYNFLFIQTEFKGGYINMPDIRTTYSTSDKANQHFFFTQANLVFGANINLKCKKAKKE